MSPELYASYMKIENPIVRKVRREAFGEDIGQFSWTSADEARRFYVLLGLGPTSRVLDVCCGAGGPSLFMARTTGCDVTGIDITPNGIASATELAQSLSLADRARFVCADASEVPFEAGTFDAVICNDSINHFFVRVPVFTEWRRVLKPGGKILFTDPVVMTGMLERDEIIARSGSMGRFVFNVPGTNERALAEAGFVDVTVEDATANIASISKSWVAARSAHERELVDVEGAEAFATFQRFLVTVSALSQERRLSRFVYLAQNRYPAQVHV
jgi:SAM-dependent methyltransferase